MIRAVRTVSLLTICAVALCVTACSSNNKGKIVGKWKANVVEKPGEAMPKGAEVVFEFTEDGRFTISVELGGQSLLKAASGKYALGFGDTVTLTELSPPVDGKTQSRERISINGDTMTIDSEKGQKQTLTRMK
jgi:uncharacterized protein (TIGR03066 family)